jgi:LacI family transcriptional regulator
MTTSSEPDVSSRGRATAKDVGALAGVSTASVSRVLSGRRPVSDDVRGKVMAAAAELGYVPNHFGRALRRQRSGTLGLLVPQITNPFFPLLIEEFEAAAQDSDFHVLIAVSHYDVDTERQRLRELVALNVDACLIVPASWKGSQDAIREAHAAVPLTQLDGRTPAKDVFHIGMDNRHAISLLVSHLVERGRRSIAFVTGGLATSPDVERYEAFKAVARRPAQSASFSVVKGLDYSFATGRWAAEQVVQAGTRADAVICSNDMIALALIEELGRLGRRVPDDVAVCGVDDIDFASLLRPTLTTVRQPLKRMSQLAMERLTQEVEPGASAGKSQRVKGDLVVRMSTGGDDPALTTSKARRRSVIRGKHRPS